MAQQSEAIRAHEVWRLACNFTEPHERLFAAVTLRAAADGDREFVRMAAEYFKPAAQPFTGDSTAPGGRRIGNMQRFWD